jgi:transforming growth factor-beta-induced protein
MSLFYTNNSSLTHAFLSPLFPSPFLSTTTYTYSQNDERGLRSSSHLPPSSNHQVQRRNGGVKGKRSSSSRNSISNSNKKDRHGRRGLSKGGKSKKAKDNLFRFLFMEKDFSDITELLVRATLAGALESGGPFTLFAPTNNAFDNLPLGTKDLLFKKDAFLPHLRTFLFNHLLGAPVDSGDLTNGLVLGTFSGEAVQFNIDPVTGFLHVNGILITKTDQQVLNGVVQEIDGAALSPGWVFASLTGRLSQIASTSIILALLTQAGIDLSVSGEFTLLAPVDEAFTQLSTATQTCLTAVGNELILQDVLFFHVIKGVLLSTDFEDGKKYKTLEGGKVKATTPPLQFEGNVNVLGGDILANNGVLHIIDAVLDPGSSICPF